VAWLSQLAGDLGKIRSLALVGAIAWNLILIVGTFVVPVYSGDGTAGRSSDTLVGVNGAWVAGLVAIPLVITLFVTSALWRRRAAQTAGPTAWTVTGLLIAFNLLAMLSIGIFVLPVTICLVVACAQSRRLA
jgi:hypothetical protein